MRRKLVRTAEDRAGLPGIKSDKKTDKLILRRAKPGVLRQGSFLSADPYLVTFGRRGDDPNSCCVTVPETAEETLTERD